MKTLLVIFKNLRLEKEQAEALRKDINHRTENRYDLLHNHLPEGGLVYRYPRVQYRSFKGYAALFGINEGAELLWQLLDSGELGEPFNANFEIISKSDMAVEVQQQFSTYSVKDLVPFNAENYRAYRALESFIERSRWVEEKLAVHLVQFCKEMGVKFEKGEIKVRLKALKKTPEPELKAERMLSFDLVFDTNVSLPDYLSLGRMKSLGMGTLKKLRG